MMGNTFGRVFRVTTCGESYSGCFRKNLDIPRELYGGLITIVDGVPAGIRISAEDIQIELDKRRPGQTPMDSPRRESDKAIIFSGVMEDDLSTGAPIGILIPNNNIEDTQIEQYRGYKDLLRPGHAEYTFLKKYGEYTDWVAAGRASGRETTSRVAGGAVAKIILDKMGIDVIGFITESHGIKARPITYEMAKENYRKNELNCPDLEIALKMIEDIIKTKDSGDSCGGIVEIIARGVPTGLGEPVFDKLEATMAHALMSIGAIKGIEFGSGFKMAEMLGSESNDQAYIDEKTGRVRFKTNNAGGFLGGISNGEEIRVRLAVKPTPTLTLEQDTVNIKEFKNTKIISNTHRFASLLPRIYPICEAMIRIAILDSILMAKSYRAITDIDKKWDGI